MKRKRGNGEVGRGKGVGTKEERKGGRDGGRKEKKEREREGDGGCNESRLEREGERKGEVKGAAVFIGWLARSIVTGPTNEKHIPQTDALS